MVNFPKSANNATIAFYFLLGLEAGMFEDDCAKDWAYKIIEISENPPIDIIEVATANRREAIFEALNLVAGERDTTLAGKWLLANLRDSIQSDTASLKRAIKRAMHVSSSCGLPHNVYYAFDIIDDELYLAENDSYGTVEQCRADLLSTLSEFGVSPVVET